MEIELIGINARSCADPDFARRMSYLDSGPTTGTTVTSPTRRGGAAYPGGGWLLSRDGNAEHIRVSVYDSAQAGIVIAIRVYVAATGKFVREERR